MRITEAHSAAVITLLPMKHNKRFNRVNFIQIISIQRWKHENWIIKSQLISIRHINCNIVLSFWMRLCSVFSLDFRSCFSPETLLLRYFFPCSHNLNCNPSIAMFVIYFWLKSKTDLISISKHPSKTFIISMSIRFEQCAVVIPTIQRKSQLEKKIPNSISNPLHYQKWTYVLKKPSSTRQKKGTSNDFCCGKLSVGSFLQLTKNTDPISIVFFASVSFHT